MQFFKAANHSRFGPVPSFDPALDDGELAAARDAARWGDWEPARDVLTAAYGDWERRAHRVNVLGEFAAGHPKWLDAWSTAEPTNAALAVVRARTEIARAWNARGGGWASQTSDRAFRTFAQILNRAEGLLDRATELAFDDPSPWIWYLWLSIGREEPWPVFDHRWSELVARDPHNYLGHEARFQRTCRKWAGSHEQMYEFCRAAAESAPPGSPVAVLPLQAHFEVDLWERGRGESRAKGMAAAVRLWRSEQVREDINVATERWLGGGAPTHALAMKARSVLARALTMAGRHQEAATHFAAIGPYVSDYPWYYEDSGAREGFLRARKRAVVAAS